MTLYAHKTNDLSIKLISLHKPEQTKPQQIFILVPAENI